MIFSPYHATLGLAPGGWQLIQHKSNDNLEMRQWQSWRYSAGLWSGDISSTFAELALQVQDHPRCHSGWEKKSTTRFGLCKGWWWAVWPFGQLTLEDTQAEIQKIHFFRLFDGKWTLDHSLVKIIFFLGADCALVPVWRFLPPFPAAWGESRSFRIHTYCIFAHVDHIIGAQEDLLLTSVAGLGVTMRSGIWRRMSTTMTPWSRFPHLTFMSYNRQTDVDE